MTIMSEHPFSYLLALVQCDQKIDSLKKNSEKLAQEVSNLRTEKEQLEREMQDAQKKVVTAKKNVDAQELEMKTLDQQEQHKKVILANISDYKQYQSVKIEIDGIQKKQLEQEQLVIEAWNQLEAAQSLCERKQQDQVAKEQEMIATIQEKESRMADIIIEIERTQAERPAKAKVVPAEWLEKYNTIHARVSDPIVSVHNDVCSACSQTIIPSDLLRIRRGALMQCKGCFRLIYASDFMDTRG